MAIVFNADYQFGGIPTSETSLEEVYERRFVELEIVFAHEIYHAVFDMDHSQEVAQKITDYINAMDGDREFLDFMLARQIGYITTREAK